MPGINSMPYLNESSDVFWNVTQSIKNALDPEGILAPGRYQPTHFADDEEVESVG